MNHLHMPGGTPGPQDDEQITALTALAVEARARGTHLLWERWAKLDRVDPITPFESLIAIEPGGSERRDCRVHAHQIVSVDGQYRRWGCINNRAFTYTCNMKTLAQCETREDFVSYLNDLSDTQLLAYPGPCGPLFQTGTDGRHRTQIIKALALPGLLVRSVEFPAVPQLAGDRARAFLDTRAPYRTVPLRGHTLKGAPSVEPAQPHPAEAPILTRPQKVRDRDVVIAHLTALERRSRIADLDVRQGPVSTTATFTLKWDLPAYWALEPPAVVERMSRRYARSYPEFTATEAGQAMCDRKELCPRVMLDLSDGRNGLGDCGTRGGIVSQGSFCVPELDRNCSCITPVSPESSGRPGFDQP